MKKIYIAIVAAAAVLILLGVTCPNKQAHSEEIKTAVSDYLDEELSAETSEDEEGWAMFGSIIADKLVEVFLDSKLKVNNYILFSTGEVHYQGHNKTVSFGILNHVFTFDADDIRRSVEESESDSEL